MATTSMIDANELFIGGNWVKPRGSARIAVVYDVAGIDKRGTSSVEQHSQPDQILAVSESLDSFLESLNRTPLQIVLDIAGKALR